MADLSSLWDEKKYSEGDPIRQLIAASKAYKDWPMDAVAWGADLVDLGSSGLAKLAKQNPGLAKILKTDLGGNLRRAAAEPHKELGMSEGPAPDLEAGRSIGRMLNPAFLLQGDVPGWSAASKALKNNRFSEAKRQFILGKNKAFEDEATAAIMQPTADLLHPIDEIAQTPVDRRTFMKGAAAVGAAGAAGGLLKNFGRAGEALERAPEAVRAAKAAEEVAQAAPKYKYNSLKEYLDDAQMWAKEDFKAADLSGQGARYSKDEFLKRQLLDDEALYKEAKAADMDSLIKQQKFPDYEQYQRSLNAFSPQAKQEMKFYKEDIAKRKPGENWADRFSSDMDEIYNGLKGVDY